MTDQNCHRSPPHRSTKPRPPASTSRSQLSRFLAAAAAGAIIGCAASIATVFIVALLVGHMDYEFSGLVAVSFGTVTAVPATMIGVIIGMADGPEAKAVRLLASAALGGLCSAAIYWINTFPTPGAPAAVVFWVGVVPCVSGLITGAVGGLMGIRARGDA